MGMIARTTRTFLKNAGCGPKITNAYPKSGHRAKYAAILVGHRQIFQTEAICWKSTGVALAASMTAPPPVAVLGNCATISVEIVSFIIHLS